MTQTSTKSTKKYIWKAAMIFVIAVLLFVSAGSYLMSNLLLNKVNSLRFNGITIKAEAAEVHILRNNIVLKQIEVMDTVQNRLLISKIQLDGLHYLRLIFSKQIEVDKLSFEQPQLTMNLPFQFTKSDSTSTSKIGDYEIVLNEVEITDSQINMKQSKGFLRLSTMNLKLESVRKFVKSDSTQKQFDFAKIEVNADRFLYTLKDSLYLFVAEKLAVNSREKTIKIDSASITSNYSKYEIGHQTGVETDWYQLLFGAINIEDFNPESLKNDQAFQFSFVSLEKLDAEIFRDKRLPFPDKEDTKLPMEIVNTLPFPLHIDSVFIHSGKVKYEQHAAGKMRAGAIVLSDLHAKIYEISNIEKRINTPTTMHADARVMGEGLLDVNFEFPNKKFSQANRVVGSLEPMKLMPINHILRETVRAEIQSGQINTFRFNFTYNNDVSNGSLLMEYDNLEVSMLDNEVDKEEPLKTLLVNGFALRNNNHRNKNNFHAGEIEFYRNKKKSFFNYWWKSLQSGIESVVVTVK